MNKTSESRKIFSEIELFLNAGKYEDAKVLLNFVDYDASDRETRLYLLLINATIEGPGSHKDEIDQLSNLLNPSDIEKEIIGKIVLLASKSGGGKGWKHQSQTHPLNQPRDPVASRRTLASQPRQDAELRREREAELPGFEERLAELTASRDQAVRSLQETLKQKTELLQTKEAAVNTLESRFGETIRVLENQLSEEKELLERRDAALLASRSEVNQLTARLAELGRARDQDVGLLRNEVARQAELLQVKDGAIKKIEERFEAQLHALKNQLGEKRNLLKSRDSELDSLITQVSKLTEERAELISEREKSERLILEELRGKAALLEATAAAIDGLEEQMSARIEALERQLAEKQKIVEYSGTQLADLRRQIRLLRERLADAEAAQLRAETMLHDERYKASRAFPAGDSARDSDGGAPPVAVEPVNIPSAPGQEGNLDWPSRLRRAWQITWKSMTFPASALPVAAVVLPIILIVYLILGQGPTAANPDIRAGWERTRESEASGSSASRVDDFRALHRIDADSHYIRTREAWPARAATYVTRTVVSLRERPYYAAAVKTQIGAGTQISVLETQGNWLKVKTRPTGAVGYVRREYLVRQGSTQY